MKKSSLWAVILGGAALLASACAYRPTSVQGIEVTPSQIQEIRIGRTTGLELITLLGPPARMEKLNEDDRRLVYAWTEIRSLTLPGGYRAVGLYDKVERRAFEIVVKRDRVQSYRFMKP